jgi:imidazolonepropionase-like amidohydrolase
MKTHPRSLRPGPLAAAAALLVLAAAPLAAQAPDSGRVMERGRFRLHKFEQEIGAEEYTVRDLDSVLVVQDSFRFVDRGTPVPLRTTLRLRPDLTPVAFAAKGNTARGSTIDAEVTVSGGRATVREGTETRQVEVPERFFTLGGYAPVSAQMMLVRYLARHPGGGALPVLPRGQVTVERRGVDTVATDSGRAVLTRYSVGGLIWGREALWTDAAGRLAAVVGVDAEFDHFEALRDGMEPALAKLVTSAAADGMQGLAEMAARTTPAAGGTLAITGATLIDGTGAPPVRDAVLVVRGGRIAAAGPRSRVPVPAGARVIDGRGRYVIPGLWDMHAHFEQVEWGPIYLAAGVTTVRDVGNELEFITSVRDAIAGGRGVGPRMLLAGIVDGDGPMALGVNRVNTPEQAREWVRRYHDAGFRQMKIYSSVKPEIVRAVAAEAHRLGMTVTGHVPNGMDAYQAVGAGMDQINHAPYIAAIMNGGSPVPGDTFDTGSPEARRALAFLKEHGTVVDPTLAVYEMFSHPASVPFSQFEPGVAKVAPELAAPLGNTGVPPERAAQAARRFAMLVDAVRAMHRAGIPIVAGTDQTVPGHSLHRELELYVRAGFTPMEALQAATLVPARVMGMEREVGTVQPGKAADLVLLDADPLADISNTRRISAVIAAGRVYDPAVLWRSAGFQP